MKVIPVLTPVCANMRCILDERNRCRMAGVRKRCGSGNLRFVCTVCGKTIAPHERRFVEKNRTTKIERHTHVNRSPDARSEPKSSSESA
jgi:hypothetical protein